MTIMHSSLIVLQDCDLLNLAERPEKLVITSIGVPPIAIRPSVFMDGGTQRSAGQKFNHIFVV